MNSESESSTKARPGVGDVFVVGPCLKIRGFFWEAVEASGSFSIWLFYLGLAGVLYVLGTRLLI